MGDLRQDLASVGLSFLVCFHNMALSNGQGPFQFIHPLVPQFPLIVAWGSPHPPSGESTAPPAPAAIPGKGRESWGAPTLTLLPIPQTPM